MKRIKFKKFAGVRKNGDILMSPPETIKHIDRAVWLTAQVESNGKFGCVMNYDGTGMTASLGQAVAVYPRALNDDIKRNDQGPLWKILHRLEMAGSGYRIGSFATLLNRLSEIGWFISEDGKCRWMDNGKLVSGGKIRKEFTGATNGVMPLKGKDRKNAESWVILFYDLFSQASTYEMQLGIEKEHIVKRCERAKLRFCKDESTRERTLQDKVYCEHHISSVTTNQMGMEMDLAMSMFWSNSVNAPSFALKKFCKQILDRNVIFNLAREDSAKKIIQKLGNTPFARWDDDIKNGRYQRTRKYAMKLWPKELFEGPNAIMPKNLKG